MVMVALTGAPPTSAPCIDAASAAAAATQAPDTPRTWRHVWQSRLFVRVSVGCCWLRMLAHSVAKAPLPGAAPSWCHRVLSPSTAALCAHTLASVVAPTSHNTERTTQP